MTFPRASSPEFMCTDSVMILPSESTLEEISRSDL